MKPNNFPQKLNLDGTEELYSQTSGASVKFTLEQAKDYIRPYKVYTALLTQSGGDSPAGNCSDDPQPLVIGQTYLIEFNDGTGDFTNVGAPNNNQGTYFVATGTTPNNWGTSGDVCLSYNTGAPIVTVLENTIGNIWFTYEGEGQYNINSSGLFIDNKTFVVFGSEYNENNYDGISVLIQTKVIDLIRFKTPINPNGSTLNDNLFSTSIEIRVYN